MVAEDIISNIPLIEEIGTLTKTLQALGGLIILYLIFGVINIILNRKKSKELKKINNKLKEIENILKKNKKKK